jgi:hypothetical protein
LLLFDARSLCERYPLRIESPRQAFAGKRSGAPGGARAGVIALAGHHLFLKLSMSSWTISRPPTIDLEGAALEAPATSPRKAKCLALVRSSNQAPCSPEMAFGICLPICADAMQRCRSHASSARSNHRREPDAHAERRPSPAARQDPALSRSNSTLAKTRRMLASPSMPAFAPVSMLKPHRSDGESWIERTEAIPF